MIDGTDGTYNGIGYFTCPNCGCGEWKSYPMSKYRCARCGKMMGLVLKGE